LDASKFAPSTRTDDGLQRYCLECAEKDRQYRKKRYANDPKYRAMLRASLLKHLTKKVQEDDE